MAGKNSKSPRFFCESCGAEVPRDAKNCPKCGKYFASVCCPSCGFIGEEALFRNGCPVCGYSSAGNSKSGGNLPEGKKAAGPLPLWVYILTAAVFMAILAALLFKLT
jgi:uncharacterized membrane protein YvbJ